MVCGFISKKERILNYRSRVKEEYTISGESSSLNNKVITCIYGRSEGTLLRLRQARPCLCVSAGVWPQAGQVNHKSHYTSMFSLAGPVFPFLFHYLQFISINLLTMFSHCIRSYRPYRYFIFYSSSYFIFHTSGYHFIFS